MTHRDRCRRCDNCTGERLATATSEARRATAQRQLSQAGVALEPHKMWPTALSAIDIDLSGRIAADEGSEVGRALARFSDLGYGKAVRAVCGPDSVDTEVPEILVRAVVDVLHAWRSEWTERPSGIVTVGSHTHPLLIASLAAAIGDIGSLPVLGEARHTGPSAIGPRRTAPNECAPARAFELDDSVRTALRDSLAGRSVFLVDDVSASGWTLSLVSRLLLQAGAGAVYPLVLGVAA